MIYPPYNFGVVDEGIYRSGAPSSINFSFLSTLNLKTVIYLAAGDTLDEKFVEFLKQSNIKLMLMPCSNPIAEETVVQALNVIVDRENRPILVACQSGKNITGAVIGCHRKLKKWSLLSIFEEYRRFVGYTSSWTQQQHEQFIELFDNDLVRIPP